MAGRKTKRGRLQDAYRIAEAERLGINPRKVSVIAPRKQRKNETLRDFNERREQATKFQLLYAVATNKRLTKRERWEAIGNLGYGKAFWHVYQSEQAGQDSGMTWEE